MKSVCIRSFSGPFFPAFRLNTWRYSVSLCIQSECRKMRTRKIPNTETFLAVRFYVLTSQVKEQSHFGTVRKKTEFFHIIGP